MRIEDLCKEQILWEGKPVPDAARKRRKNSGCASVSLIFGIIGALTLFNHVSLSLSVLLILPLVTYLLRLHNAFVNARRTEYCVTEKGVYIQHKGPNSYYTAFKAYKEMRVIKAEEGVNGTGHVICEYNESNRATPNAIRPEDLPDYRSVFRMIQEQRDAAELYMRPYSEFAAQPAVLSHPDDDKIVAEKSYVERKDNLPSAEDMFFGDSTHSFMRERDRGAFLDPTVPASSDFLDTMPTESVSDLQKELFEGEALREEVFPDPSVNPLPLLQELQDKNKDDDNAGSGLFHQSGF